MAFIFKVSKGSLTIANINCRIITFKIRPIYFIYSINFTINTEQEFKLFVEFNRCIHLLRVNIPVMSISKGRRV